MRSAAYFVLPVPLALFAMGMGVLVFGRLPGATELLMCVWLVPLALILGYLGMGLQSALFAAVMLWMDRRGASLATRGCVAAVLGGLAGASLGPCFAYFGRDPWLWARLAALGAAVGVVTTDLVDMRRGSRSQAPKRQRVRELLVVLTLLVLTDAAAAFAYGQWAEAARNAVLGKVIPGMSRTEVERVAGRAPDEDRVEGAAAGAAAESRVWIYHERDPASSEPLRVSVEFENGEVVRVRRELLSRP